jgi:cytochrome c553
MMRKLLASVALLSTAGLAAGSVVDGMNASTPCQACHGANGVAISDDIPNLAGQQTVYLQAQLNAFKSGDRKHDVMGPIARQLSDADVTNLAAFWNSLPVGGAQKEAVAAAVTARRPQMTFPGDFPAAYVNYYTQEDAPTKSVTRYYANSVALQAARAGKPLPNGSIIMVEGSTGGTTTYFSGMEVREGWGSDVPELLRNGDWGYGLFNAQKVRGEKNNYAMCLACHKGVEADSFVFTLGQLKSYRAGIAR